MNFRPIVASTIYLMITFGVSLCVGFSAKAGLDDDTEMSSNDGKVEIIYPQEINEPYRDRRSNWAFVFGVGHESMTPDSFKSSQDGSSYKALFGSSPVNLIQVSTGMKYNFSLGAITLEGVISSGQVKSGNSGIDRTLTILKRGLIFGWVLDSIFKEPYVAPYVAGQVFELDYGDKGSATGDTTGTTAPTSAATAGLLIQLNSIDPTDAAIRANRDYGLNNTFLDIYMTQYNTSTSKTDPDLETSLSWGAALRLEF